MLIGTADIDEYNIRMKELKETSRIARSYVRSWEFKNGIKLKKFQLLMHSGRKFFKKAAIYTRNTFDESVILPRKITKFSRKKYEMPAPNYFSDKRIAVYTCVFGKYDELSEPVCQPNNVDYYIITDQSVPKTSKWKKVDISEYAQNIKGLSNVEKNRWFKMHPHLVFKDYKYSVYMDGNIIPVSDLTEYINRLGKCGIGMFWHNNNCVYQEAYWNRYSIHKINKEELDKHVRYLKAKGMPENYGLVTCNVIVRDHENPLCIRIMDEWWQEFCANCKRDMISFPYVVWKNKVPMDDIATLGYCVWDDDSVIVKPHVVS